MSRQLRLALGMRGGVSLSVWIGGAEVEIDILCRDDEPGFWRELRTMSGFDSVIVDVIAGASAGGLNGVLFAASQQYGFPLKDSTRRVAGGRWHRDAHPHQWRITVLARRRREIPACGPRPAQTADRFGATADRPAAGSTSSCRRPSSNRSSGRPAALSTSDSPNDARPPASPSTTIPRGGPTDFPAVDDPEFDSGLWRLAVAARATSSFPVAFEGTFVRSTRADSYAVPPRRPQVASSSSTCAACSASATPTIDPHRPTRHDRATSSSPTAASSTTSLWARRSRRSSELPPTGPRPATSSTSTPERPSPAQRQPSPPLRPTRAGRRRCVVRRSAS